MLSTTKECFEFIAKNWTKEMYKKEYQRRQQSGQGQRGYGMQGYGRRGLFNTVMGINAPGAIQRRQYLSQIAGPTYADGTPVIGGALPEGYHLRTGKAGDGDQGMEYVHNNLMDRVFRGKDAEGNRNPRLPKKSIKYYFEGPNDTTPSLDGGNNGISDFKPTPTPRINPAPIGPANDPGREGFNADSDGNNIPDYLQYENTAPGMAEAENAPAGPVNDPGVNRGIREKGAYVGNEDLGTEIGDRGSLMSSGKTMRNSRKAGRLENRAERKSNRDFRKIGREAKRTYEGKNVPLSEKGEARMNQGYQYGGYQEGDEVYMNPDEVAQFMAAGGQIEFL